MSRLARLDKRRSWRAQVRPHRMLFYRFNSPNALWVCRHAFGFGRDHRQFDAHPSPPPRLAFQLDRAAIGFDDRLADGQPQAKTPGGEREHPVAAAKAFEYVRKILCRNAFARIVDAKSRTAILQV